MTPYISLAVARTWRRLLIALLSIFLFAGRAQAINHEATISVILELADPPVTQVFAAQQTGGSVDSASTAAATRAQLAQIEAAQQSLLSTLAAMDAVVIYRTQRVYNGIAIRINPAEIDHVASLPGVIAIHPLVAKFPLNTRSVPAIGAPALWQGLTGSPLTGDGITIAIIDTGIDYLHTDFGGPGVGYAENDVTRIDDSSAFPSVKIIGGTDFTGDSYNADPDSVTYNSVLSPDPDPMDCYPHGTAVAGTAAGYGVQSNGATYSGAYRNDIDFAGLKIGPGVAPLAQLYALKVFGCSGSSEVVDLGLEWAVDPNGDGDLLDHVDVINLSLGSYYGSSHDMTSRAAENAAAIGVIVVAAAGNDGDTSYVVNSPSVADSVISVAAGWDGVPSFSSRGPRRLASALKPDLSAPGSAIFTARFGTGSEGRAASGTSLSTPHVAGGMALLRQRHPTWTPAELKALVMNTARTQITMGNVATAATYSPVRVGAGLIDLPRAVTATTWAANAEQPALVSVSFGAPEVLERYVAQQSIQIANFSTQATTYTVTYAAITDAPGVTITMPVTSTQVAGSGYGVIPVQLAADAAAMRRQRDVTEAETQSNDPRHWLSEESGQVLVWPPQTPFTVTLTTTTTVRLDYTPATRNLRYVINTQPLSATLSSLTIARGGSVDATTTYMLYTNDGQGDNNWPFIGSVTLAPADQAAYGEGRLALFMRTGGPTESPLVAAIAPPTPPIHVPVYAAARPASALRAEQTSLDFGDAITGVQTISLSGIELQASQTPTDVRSLLSVVELHATSPHLPPSETALVDQGFADLKYVGVGSDLILPANGSSVQEPVAEAKVYFAIATYENWASPNEVEFDIIMDVNDDGIDDYVLFNTNSAGYISQDRANDVFITALRNLHTGAVTRQEWLNNISPALLDTALFNSSVMLLPVRVQALGLSAANSKFTFRVESYSQELARNLDGTRRRVDSTEQLHYDFVQPGLHFTTPAVVGTTLVDQPTSVITVDFFAPTYIFSTAQGVLLLHHHNISTLRSETIAVQTTWRAKLYLPIIGGLG